MTFGQIRPRKGIEQFIELARLSRAEGGAHRFLVDGATLGRFRSYWEQLRVAARGLLGGGYMNDFYAREFWRFVAVQQRVADSAKTAIDFPPMQAPASFNLEAVKARVEEMMKEHDGQ